MRFSSRGHAQIRSQHTFVDIGLKKLEVQGVGITSQPLVLIAARGKAYDDAIEAHAAATTSSMRIGSSIPRELKIHHVSQVLGASDLFAAGCGTVS
eukprot:s3182_g2.t1